MFLNSSWLKTLARRLTLPEICFIGCITLTLSLLPGKKDKKKGWYIYYWTFNHPRVKDLIKGLKKKRLDILQKRVKREKSIHFFMCENKCIRLEFEQATEFNFKCPECGILLNQEDNTKLVKELEKELKDLEKEVKKFK